MRLVPDMLSIRNTATKTAIQRLRLRQEHFNNHIGDFVSIGIDSIDIKVQNQTLRQRIMSIPSRTDPHFPLFHTVTPLWRGEGMIFYFLPHLRSEA